MFIGGALPLMSSILLPDCDKFNATAALNTKYDTEDRAVYIPSD